MLTQADTHAQTEISKGQQSHVDMHMYTGRSLQTQIDPWSNIDTQTDKDKHIRRHNTYACMHIHK